MTEWQPIETAPRDGTSVIIGWIFVIMGETDFNMAFASWAGDCWIDWDCRELPDATHWMPLPKPPQ